MNTAQIHTLITKNKFSLTEIRYLENQENIVLRLRQKIEEEKEKYKKNIEKINNEIKTIQEKCCHPISYFCGDASGGNDSYSVCEICNKEI